MHNQKCPVYSYKKDLTPTDNTQITKDDCGQYAKRQTVCQNIIFFMIKKFYRVLKK